VKKIRAEVIAKENPLLAPQTLYLEQSVALQRSLECSCARKTLLQSSVTVIAELTTGDYFGGVASVNSNNLEKCILVTFYIARS
jgi:hypothetical protein